MNTLDISLNDLYSIPNNITFISIKMKRYISQYLDYVVDKSQTGI